MPKRLYSHSLQSTSAIQTADSFDFIFTKYSVLCTGLLQHLSPLPLFSFFSLFCFLSFFLQLFIELFIFVSYSFPFLPLCSAFVCRSQKYCTKQRYSQHYSTSAVHTWVRHVLSIKHYSPMPKARCNQNS